MKIGVTQIILGNASLEETLLLCEEAGYECVELVFCPGKDLDPDMNTEELHKVGQKCAEVGIEIASVIARYADRGNLLSPDKEERERGKKSLVRSLEIGSALGVNATLLHPGQLTPEGTYETAWDYLLGILKELAPVASEKKVAICLENVWNKFLLSPREMKEFIDAIGSNWIGVYLDTANMMAYGYTEHWVRSLKGRIKKVHLKDFRRKEHRFVPLMEGDTHWPLVMKELRTIGYDDSLIHEVSGDRATQIEMARRMKRIVAMSS